MPVSTSVYTELRFTISDYVQRREWKRLFEVCGTEDDEVARTIGVIMSGYDPRHIWAFLDYVMKLSKTERLEREHSVATVCYVIAKMGQTNVRKSLSFLKELLLENQNLRDAILLALSNLWVLDPRTTTETLYNTWIKKSDSSVLQQVAVSSCEYLAKNDPAKTRRFLQKVSSLEGKKVASKESRKYMHKYPPPPTKGIARKKHPKKEKRKKKKHKKS